MIKCNKCGSSNNDGSNFCKDCGNSLNVNNINVNNNVNVSKGSNEKFLFGLLAFLFPIIGLIVGCIYTNRDKEISKVSFITAGISVLIKVIALIFLIFFFSIFTIGFIGETGNYINKCSNYCEGTSYSINNDICTCGDGRKYDLEEDKIINDNHGDNDSHDDNNLNNKDIVIDGNPVNYQLRNWKNDINSGKEVVTVIASSTCPHCKEYKPVITDIANKYNINLYFFEADELTNNDYDILTDIDDDKFSFTGSVPFTFIIRNNKYVDDKIGYNDEAGVIGFLNRNNFNVDANYTYENNGI